MKVEFTVPTDGSLRALVQQQIREYEALVAELVAAFQAMAQAGAGADQVGPCVGR